MSEIYSFYDNILGSHFQSLYVRNVCMSQYIYVAGNDEVKML